jgi:thiamine biosynthesis lipoprotein
VRTRHILFLSFLLIAACGDSDLLPAYDLSGSTMGTTFNVTLVAPPADIDLESLQTRIQDRLEHVDKIASTYRGDSELSRFNAEPSTDWVRVMPEFCRMIASANEISFMTQGAFDITVGPLVNLWGFGPEDRQENRDVELPTDEEISAARTRVGYEMLETDCDHSVIRKASATVYVDLSGWAKGYAVDQIAQLLDEQHLTNYLVEIGGELRVRGHNTEQRKFSVAIEKPLPNNEMSYTLVRLSDVSVATSGDYRNFFEHDGRRYSHSIDPRTGRPVSDELVGVTVVSTQTAYADAVATAFLVLGPEEGHALAEKLRIAAYFLVRTDNGIEEKSTSQFEQLRRM